MHICLDISGAYLCHRNMSSESFFWERKHERIWQDVKKILQICDMCFKHGEPSKLFFKGLLRALCVVKKSVLLPDKSSSQEMGPKTPVRVSGYQLYIFIPGTPRPTIYFHGCLLISKHFLYTYLVHHPTETSIYTWLALGFQVDGSPFRGFLKKMGGFPQHGW